MQSTFAPTGQTWKILYVQSVMHQTVRFVHKLGQVYITMCSNSGIAVQSSFRGLCVQHYDVFFSETGSACLVGLSTISHAPLKSSAVSVLPGAGCAFDVNAKRKPATATLPPTCAVFQAAA